MFPTEHTDHIFVYEHSFCIPDDFIEILERGASNDWSFVTFSKVVAGSEDICTSEMASLYALSTDVDDQFVDYLRQTVNSISESGIERAMDYSNTHDLAASESSLYDLLRFTKFGQQHASAVLGDNLQEGLIVEICSLSPEAMLVEFPALDIEVPMNQGDILIAPGGFPFAHRILTKTSNIILKRIFR